MFAPFICSLTVSCRRTSSEFECIILFPYFNIYATFFPELESSKKQAEADKKAIDDLVRERDILNKVRQYVHTLYLS